MDAMDSAGNSSGSEEIDYEPSETTGTDTDDTVSQEEADLAADLAMIGEMGGETLSQLQQGANGTFTHL